MNTVPGRGVGWSTTTTIHTARGYYRTRGRAVSEITAPQHCMCNLEQGSERTEDGLVHYTPLMGGRRPGPVLRGRRGTRFSGGGGAQSTRPSTQGGRGIE